MPKGSSQEYRGVSRWNMMAQSAQGALPTPVPLSKVVVGGGGGLNATLVPSASVTSYIPSSFTALASVTVLTAQALINGYFFFSNITNKNPSVLARELVASAILMLLCLAELGLAMYYFFAKIDCSIEDSAACNTGLLLSALKVGIGIFAAAGSELVKRSFAEEQAIRVAGEERRALRRNRRLDPFFSPNTSEMQITHAPVFMPGAPPLRVLEGDQIIDANAPVLFRP